MASTFISNTCAQWLLNVTFQDPVFVPHFLESISTRTRFPKYLARILTNRSLGSAWFPSNRFWVLKSFTRPASFSLLLQSDQCDSFHVVTTFLTDLPLAVTKRLRSWHSNVKVANLNSPTTGQFPLCWLRLRSWTMEYIVISLINEEKNKR